MKFLEYFTPIEGFPDYYINRQGVVISRRVWHRNKYGEPKVLTPDHDRAGYLTVDLRDAPNSKHHKFVHQLVAMTFIPNPNGYLYVNHKDRNKENNNVENLEWCTKAMNNKHTFTVGSRMRGKKSCITFYGSPIIYGNNATELAEYAAANCGVKIGPMLQRKCRNGIQIQLLEPIHSVWHLYRESEVIFSSQYAKDCYSYANEMFGTGINHKKPYSCKYRLYVCKNDENPNDFWDKHYNHR